MMDDHLGAFWDWAVAQYEAPELRACLLECQERAGLVILEALFLAWLGRKGHSVTALEYKQLRAAIEPWVAGVVIPLRAQRKEWTDEPALAAHRRHLLGLELEAERVLSTLLTGAIAINTATQCGADCVAKNLDHLSDTGDFETKRRLLNLLVR